MSVGGKSRLDSRHPVDAFLILLDTIVPSQYDFPNLHSHNGGGKLRGKFRRLMLAIPSIFPSKTTHSRSKAGKSQSEYEGLCFMMKRKKAQGAAESRRFLLREKFAAEQLSADWLKSAEY